MKPIREFWGVFRFLSNFQEAEIEWRGKTYATTEHAYQAAKAGNEAQHDLIRRSLTPGQAKRNGQRVPLRSDWEEIKDQIMYEVCLAKFSQHDTLNEALQATGDRELLEGNSWGDFYWGVCNKTGEGRNQLGKTLMRIREELATDDLDEI